MYLTPPSFAPPRRPGPRAALLLIVIGIAELLLFGGCAARFVLTDPSLDELRQSSVTLPPQVSEQQFLAMARGMQMVVAAVVVLLLVLPGLALIVMSPQVGRGVPGAVTGARVILWGHVALVGCMVLFNLAMSLLMLSPLNLLVSVILLGGLLALLWQAIVSLRAIQTLPAHTPDDEDFEPWNSHLA